MELRKMKKSDKQVEAYLDIETTGLSPNYSQITVVGIYITNGTCDKFLQLVGEDITGDAVLESLVGVDTLYTYNGSRFELPFINARHKVDLAGLYDHCDLMFHCWNKNLYGGLKSVECQLGIDRRLKEVNGYEAVRLWWRYVNDYDQDALKLLLEYNKEDVVNLKALRDRLL